MCVVYVRRSKRENTIYFLVKPERLEAYLIKFLPLTSDLKELGHAHIGWLLRASDKIQEVEDSIQRSTKQYEKSIDWMNRFIYLEIIYLK
jgi:predicted metal-dependent hydrolase